MTERDVNLDLFRGFAMIYITCVVHLICWMEPDIPHKYLILFEMPLIFFIAGAAHTFSKKKNYIKYVKGRINRVVIPYWGFLLIIYCIVTILFLCFDGKPVNNKAYLGAIFLTGSGHGLGMPRTSHLWFVMPYFLISILVPLFYNIIKKELYCKKVAFAIILCCVIYLTFTTFYLRNNSLINRGGNFLLYVVLCDGLFL